MCYAIVLVFCIAVIPFEISATKPRMSVKKVRKFSRERSKMKQHLELVLLTQVWQQQYQQQVLQQNAQNHQWPLPLQNGRRRTCG